MDAATLRLLFVFTDLILPLIVGYYIHKWHILSDATITKVIKINVTIVYTLLALLSFWVLPLSWSLLLVPIFAFLLVLVPGGISYVLFARKIPNLLDRGAYMSSAFLANLGTIGGICAFILYNEQGFAYSQIIGTCQNIMLVLVVFPLAQYYYLKTQGKVQKTSRLHLFVELFFSPTQISLLGIIIGFTLNACGIERPASLAPVFQSFVHISAWIAMLPVGFLIDFSKVRQYIPMTHSLTFMRFILTPIVFCILVNLLVHDPVLHNTLIIMSFCPTAINAVITAKLYHLTIDLAMASFLITTTAFLLVIFPALFFIIK